MKPKVVMAEELEPAVVDILEDKAALYLAAMPVDLQGNAAEIFQITYRLLPGQIRHTINLDLAPAAIEAAEAPV